MVAKERHLIYTFRKVLYDEIKESQNYKCYQNLIEIYRKYAEFCEQHSKKTNRIGKYDALIYEYLLQRSCDINPFQKI